MGRGRELFLTFLVVYVFDGQTSAQLRGTCSASVKDGVLELHKNDNCNMFMKFKCDIKPDDWVINSMECGPPYSKNGGYTCIGVCPDRETNFLAICRSLYERWEPPLNSVCQPNTTPSPPSKSSETTIIITITVVIVLTAIMVIICGLAIKASRRRRQAMQNNPQTNSPTMIYSVALECGVGQALRNSINSYMQQTNQQSGHTNTACSLDVAKPPSYEEAMSRDFGGVDFPCSPPPYSEVSNSNVKNTGTA